MASSLAAQLTSLIQLPGNHPSMRASISGIPQGDEGYIHRVDLQESRAAAVAFWARPGRRQSLLGHSRRSALALAHFRPVTSVIAGSPPQSPGSGRGVGQSTSWASCLASASWQPCCKARRPGRLVGPAVTAAIASIHPARKCPIHVTGIRHGNPIRTTSTVTGRQMKLPAQRPMCQDRGRNGGKV